MESDERSSSIGRAGVMATACTHRRPDATREAPAVITVSINWQLARDRPGPCGVAERGAADKAANLARWKSWCRQLPVFGRLAYPVRAEATKHVLPGCKSLGCPAAVCAAVGTTWETSKLGGLNIKKCLQPRKHPPREVVFAERSGKPTQTSLGEGRRHGGRNRYTHSVGPPW